MTPIYKFIALTTDKSNKEVSKSWYSIVREYAPSGVLTTCISLDEENIPTTVAMVKRQENEFIHFIIPLSRDLSDDEAEEIVNAFVEINPEIDFDISISNPLNIFQINDEASAFISKNKYMNMCLAFAKLQHDNWVSEKTKEGWSYGPTINIKSKKHPLLRPWKDLPEEFKKVDKELPQRLLNLFNEYGFHVITKDEYSSLLRMIKN